MAGWAPPKGEVEPTYAIASDLLSVVCTEDGFGSFPTEAAALESQIARLDAEIDAYREARSIATKRLFKLL